MAEKNKIYINNRIVGFGGVIGRRAYIKNIIILTMISFLISMVPIIIMGFSSFSSYNHSLLRSDPYSTFTTLSVMFGGVYGLFYVLSFIVSTLVGSGLLLRRIRDIRGTTDDEVIWFAGIIAGDIIVSFIPILNMICWLSLGLFLFIKKGIITNPEALTLQELWTQITGGNGTSNNSGNNSNTKTELVTLEKLYELKQKGAISEEEYNKTKEKLIRNI